MESALLLSLKLSALTTLILILVSLPLAYMLSFKEFRGRLLLESLILMPILIPPTVLGFYMVYLLGNNSDLGRFIETLTGVKLLFSFEGLVFASIIYSLPFGVFPIRDAFQNIPRRYIEIAYAFGYSPLESFFKVILPNSWSGILTSTALVFAHTMGEFGEVLMVGGNIPGETRTLSIYIYDEVQALNYRGAHLASLVLLSVSLCALAVIFFFRRWSLR